MVGSHGRLPKSPCQTVIPIWLCAGGYATPLPDEGVLVARPSGHVWGELQVCRRGDHAAITQSSGLLAAKDLPWHRPHTPTSPDSWRLSTQCCNRSREGVSAWNPRHQNALGREGLPVRCRGPVHYITGKTAKARNSTPLLESAIDRICVQRPSGQTGTLHWPPHTSKAAKSVYHGKGVRWASCWEFW